MVSGMKRTEIQKAIIPRNWLFGRLSYIHNNLKTMLFNKDNFTEDEMESLLIAEKHLKWIVHNKKANSEVIKFNIKNERKTI